MAVFGVGLTALATLGALRARDLRGAVARVSVALSRS